MARGKPKKPQSDPDAKLVAHGATTGHEAELWRMADTLRGSMDAAEYKHVVLGLIFLKYISDAFEEKHAPPRRREGTRRRPGGPGRVPRREYLMGVARGPLDVSQGPGTASHHRPARPELDKQLPLPIAKASVVAVHFVSMRVVCLTNDKRIKIMPSLSKRIMEHATGLPEGAPLCPGALLDLGNRAAVDQALSRLARSGRLMRIYQAVYMRPIETRFGLRAPALEKVIASFSRLWGDTIVPCGGAAANLLGLTAQMPVRPVYLTSGPTRWLRLGALTVQLRHAPRWQLVAPYRLSGDAIRALAWLGPQEVEEGLGLVAPRLSSDDLAELAAARATMPAWMAEPVSALVAHG